MIETGLELVGARRLELRPLLLGRRASLWRTVELAAGEWTRPLDIQFQLEQFGIDGQTPPDGPGGGASIDAAQAGEDK